MTDNYLTLLVKALLNGWFSRNRMSLFQPRYPFQFDPQGSSVSEKLSIARIYARMPVHTLIDEISFVSRGLHKDTSWEQRLLISC